VDVGTIAALPIIQLVFAFGAVATIDKQRDAATKANSLRFYQAGKVHDLSRTDVYVAKRSSQVLLTICPESIDLVVAHLLVS
jgi:hypothetical protein